MSKKREIAFLSPKGIEPIEVSYYEWGLGTGDWALGEKPNPQSQMPNAKIVICVHGLTRNARDFDYLAAALANNGYRVFCLDMPGRGGSSWFNNPADYNYPNYAAIVAEFLRAKGLVGIGDSGLGIEKNNPIPNAQCPMPNIYWVGTSMGGLIGMVLSAMNPGLISRMVVNDIGPFLPASALDRLASYVGVKTRFDTFEEYERELKTILAGFGIKNSEHWQHMLKHSAKQLEDGGYEMLYDPAIARIFKDEKGAIKKMEDADLWKVWSAIKHDVLVIRGMESDLLTHETAQQMLATNPKTKLVEYAGIGHAPSLMEDWQIRDVLKFLGMPDTRG